MIQGEAEVLRVGVIGAGGIAALLHLPELVAIDGVEVVLVAGRRQERLQRLCEHFGVPRSTREYGDVIEDEEVNAVVVATPHPLHVEWGVRALEAGKHVLMQKPLSANLEEAHAFVSAAAATDRTVMCLPHFASWVYSIRERCEQGAIGRVSGARCRTSHGGPEVYYAGVREFFGEPEPEGGALWFFDAGEASVGALFDMGVYAVSCLVAILGSVKRVTGKVATFDKPTRLEDVATLVLEFDSGAVATAETSWCDPARTRELSVHGTAGKLTAPGADGAEVTLWTPTSYTDEHAPVDRESIVCSPVSRNAHTHFADCVHTGSQPPLSHAWAARHVTEVLLAGLEASRSGRAVDVTTASARD